MDQEEFGVVLRSWNTRMARTKLKPDPVLDHPNRRVLRRLLWAEQSGNVAEVELLMSNVKRFR